MARRGLYVKGVERKDEILSAALSVIARDGYSAATVQQLADEVGISKTALLHYFGSKDALFREVLRRRDAQQVERFDPSVDSFHDELLRETTHDTVEPGLAQLYTRLVAEAIEPDHAAHQYFQERYRATFDLIQGRLEQLHATGAISPGVDLAGLSRLLAAVLDGLQLQRQYDPALDAAQLVEIFWSLIQNARSHETFRSPEATSVGLPAHTRNEHR